MPVLKVDLQEGFSGEPFVMRLNGTEVYRGNPKTRNQIGLADSKSFDLPAESVTLEVESPSAGASQSLVVHLAQDLNVGVSLEKGAISLRSSAEPFGYL